MDVIRRSGVARLVPGAVVARTVAAAAAAGGAPASASVTVVLTDDEELADLNAEHFGKSGPTDVLSFPMLSPDAYPAHAGAAARAPHPATAAPAMPVRHGRATRVHLGDIAISVERAVDQAEQGRGGQTGDVTWSAADEQRLLLTHGVLHLCGWDHAEPEEEAAMRALERRLLASIVAR